MAVSHQMTVVSFPVIATSDTGKSLHHSSNQYCAVGLTTAGQATLKFTTNVGALSTAQVIGVLQNNPTTAQVAAVCVAGVTKLRMAANTLDQGEGVAASSIGLGIAPTSNNWKIGTILYGSSGAAGRVVTINLALGGHTTA